MDVACSEDMRAEMEAAAEARKRAGEEEEGGPAKRSKGEPLGADVLEVLNEVGGVRDQVGIVSKQEAKPDETPGVRLALQGHLLVQDCWCSMQRVGEVIRGKRPSRPRCCASHIQ